MAGTAVERKTLREYYKDPAYKKISRPADWHRAFGLHSGIPPCCVEFWMEFAFPNSFKPSDKNHNPQVCAYLSLQTRSEHDKWQYIPCPNCFFTGHTVELHRCTDECDVFWFNPETFKLFERPL